ncbi:MAG: relaxasome subunit MobC [Lachnospiraceae bacterium]|nr:relaxasome subunit MobC [Lachnospiraceae bacterium]
MNRKSYDERLDEIRKKKEQLQARERDIMKRKSEEDRKKRTKRLIELGGIIESVLGRATTDEDKIRLLNFLKKQETNGKFFTSAMNDGVKL